MKQATSSVEQLMRLDRRAEDRTGVDAFCRKHGDSRTPRTRTDG